MQNPLPIPLGRRARLRAAAALVAAILSLSVVGAIPGPIQVNHPRDRASAALLSEARSRPNTDLTVIVRERHPHTGDAENLVRALGGHVVNELPILNGFTARLPARGVHDLLTSPVIQQAWPDGDIRMAGATNLDGYDSNSANQIWRQAIGLPRDFRSGGPTGQGATVALIDTGVTNSADLGNRVLARVDLTPAHDGYDRYGHGTHMSGLIAGDGMLSGGKWEGAAPRANLVSIKVAGRDGSTDVSIVLAALQWVVAHRTKYNIRVLNLSYGTDSVQSYRRDPLDFAVERAWFSGIFVVVAAGNGGPSAGTIDKPGDDPYVLTVGGASLNGTIQPGDDTVAPFSSRGPTQDDVAKPDIVAPGISLVSIRAPGSTIDREHPLAVIDENYFKGTGTSQATAVVSGVAALMFAANPSLSPNVAKSTLIRTARPAMSGKPGAGAGLVNAGAAVQAAAAGTYASATANSGLIRSSGLGSLEASRGTQHVFADVTGDGSLETVSGEIDVLGHPWNPTTWVSSAWSSTTWASSAWSALTASTLGWQTTVFGGATWGGVTWDSKSWAAKTWSGDTWDASKCAGFTCTRART
jgi:serine protease AprX